MHRYFFLLCILAGAGHAFWKEVTKLVDKVGEVVPDPINPLNLVYVNRCVSDLGCFYTGPPFFHPVNRPLSLPPTAKPRVRFLLFTPQNPHDEYLLKISQESLRNSRFDPELGIKFLIHGFLSDLDYDDVRFEMKDAMLKYGDYNVIVVDWTRHNGFPFAQAVANTRVVGALVAKMVHFLMNETGISPSNVHIIGHSLGGQAAGYAGERIEDLGRITGLDPAGPYFQLAGAEVRLDVTDATFVDVVHSDGAEFVLNGLGMSAPIGHVDFYPNGGRRQPGCAFTASEDNVVGGAINFTTKWISNGCDHSRANTFFRESINNTVCRFVAVRCDSYKDFEKGRCPPETSTRMEMGFHAKPIPGLESPAKFFLRTNEETPFCNQDSIFL